MYFKETGYGDVNWMKLALDRGLWQSWSFHFHYQKI